MKHRCLPRCDLRLFERYSNRHFFLPQKPLAVRSMTSPANKHPTIGASASTPGSEAQAPKALPNRELRYIDVGINLTDPVFRGVYHGRRAHENDLDDVIRRAINARCIKMMVTGSDLTESKAAVELARNYPQVCFATVGVHPCQAKTFDKHVGGPEKLLSELTELARTAHAEGLAVAYGEFGLDYDRLHFADKETQLKYFEQQLDLAVELQMPLFLHSRAAASDFERLLRARLDRLPRRGLVHSFTGSVEEMRSLVEMGFDIGVNGCSLKTEENLDVVREIPMDRLQVETDGPWCEMRPSHASSKFLTGGDAPTLVKAVKKEKWQKGCMVKGRNEPCTIAQVAHVVAAVKGVSVEEVSEAAWNNSKKMFGL